MDALPSRFALAGHDNLNSMCLQPALSHDGEFWKRDSAACVLEDHVHAHVAAYGFPRRADDVAQEPRSLVQFYDRDDIRHVVLESGMIDPVIDHEAVDASLAARFTPGEITRQAMAAALRRGKPEPAASVATRQHELFRGGAFPEWRGFRGRVRQRFASGNRH